MGITATCGLRRITLSNLIQKKPFSLKFVREKRWCRRRKQDLTGGMGIGLSRISGGIFACKKTNLGMNENGNRTWRLHAFQSFGRSSRLLAVESRI